MGICTPLRLCAFSRQLFTMTDEVTCCLFILWKQDWFQDVCWCTVWKCDLNESLILTTCCTVLWLQQLVLVLLICDACKPDNFVEVFLWIAYCWLVCFIVSTLMSTNLFELCISGLPFMDIFGLVFSSIPYLSAPRGGLQFCQKSWDARCPYFVSK